MKRETRCFRMKVHKEYERGDKSEQERNNGEVEGIFQRTSK